MKRIGFNLVVAAAVLAAAPGALAGTVSRHGDRFVVKAVAGEENWYQPSHIERDSYYCPHARHGCLDFHDNNPNPLTAGPGCFIVAATPSIVRCKDPGGSVKVVIKAGDQDDIIAGTHFAEARPNDTSSRILLGAGNDYAALGPGDDRIYGGPGNESSGSGGAINAYGGDDYVDGGEGDDRLDGGTGNDRVGGGASDIGIDSMYGGPGIDALDARDGLADGTLDCGAGNDPNARRDAGLDSAPQSC